MAKIGISYMHGRVAPDQAGEKPRGLSDQPLWARALSDFFKSYTEKVWGTPCHEISAEWGAQRIKGLSSDDRGQALREEDVQRRDEGRRKDIAQKGTDTSLIERFMYPKFGPGQLWEHVAEMVRQKGGEIHMGWKVDGSFRWRATRVASIEAVNARARRGGLPATTSSRRCRCGNWCAR